MDTLTHALAGALIARATAPREKNPDALPLGRRMAVGAFAAAFPDIDFITSYLSPLSYLYHHRGITHSVILLPLWTALIAVILAAAWRGGPRWRAYAGIVAMGIGSHIATDWITAFGTMLFAPFSDARYALSTTFIIDPWFTAIIVAGLLAGLLWRSNRVPAAAAVAVLAGYVALQWVLQQQAIAFGREYAQASRIEQPRVTAMPRPVSPFNWTVIIERDGHYRYAHINLIRRTARPVPDAATGFIARLDAAYRPLGDAVWNDAALYGRSDSEARFAHEAYSKPEFGFFRWFAAYPTLLRIDGAEAERCAWFEDLRFITPGRAGTPFRFGMCRDRARGWRPSRLLGEQRLPAY